MGCIAAMSGILAECTAEGVVEKAKGGNFADSFRRMDDKNLVSLQMAQAVGVVSTVEGFGESLKFEEMIGDLPALQRLHESNKDDREREREDASSRIQLDY